MTVARLAVDRTTNTPVVFLREAVGDRGVGIWIGGSEAGAIAVALQGAQAPRPLTADLLAAMLGVLDASVEQVRITAVRGGTYFADIAVLGADGVTRWLDARPSDAIALALRVRAPIAAAASLLAPEGAVGPAPPEPLADAELREHLRNLGPEDFGRFLP